MSSVTSSATASIISASPSSTQNSNNGGTTGGPSSPLLFFVALGFGVVFTNLWIIVGVKYCFRYNQRNRARLAGEDPDAVDLAAMPQRRRRREKKLMSIEEVNEQFPLTKYKTWRSTRAEEGLPTAGGINATPSRPASIKNVPRASEDEGTTASTNDTLKEKMSPSEPSSPVTTRHDRIPTEDASQTTAAPTAVEQKKDEDEKDGAAADQIQTAIPAEQLPDPGDTCAICIDALEDDDDIRGLTCGHAFHGSCVDPWLTSRRACCPLCKADYYVPKARPEGEPEELQRRRTQEQPAAHIFLTGRRGRGPPMELFARHFLNGHQQQGRTQSGTVTGRRSREPGEAAATTTPEHQQQQSSWRSRLNLPRLPAVSRIRQGGASQPGQQPATPAQLEAGQGR